MCGQAEGGQMKRRSSRCARVFVAAALCALLSAPGAVAATIGSPLVGGEIRDFLLFILFVLKEIFKPPQVTLHNIIIIHIY